MLSGDMDELEALLQPSSIPPFFQPMILLHRGVLCGAALNDTGLYLL